MGLGEITVNDLDIGFLKRQEQRKQLQREIKAASLEKQVHNTKNLIERTCTDVWTERDQLTSFQRKNWSVRKKLMQMEDPEDSVTSLNLKIEKLVRQDRILDSDIDRANDERQILESRCGDTAKEISQLKYLLDDLHTHVVPLLSSGEPTKRNPELFLKKLKDSELDDTMHSMAGDEEASLSSFRKSQSNLRIVSSAFA
jgi:chromosome segregation ATPase